MQASPGALPVSRKARSLKRQKKVNIFQHRLSDIFFMFRIVFLIPANTHKLLIALIVDETVA
jgi:hypothetical protein